MAANRVFAPNGKMQIANCKLENGKSLLLFGFRFFDFFGLFNKLTLEHVNALQQ